MSGRSTAAPPVARFSLCVALVCVVYLAQALWLSRVLVPYHDETSALFFGYLAASGQISLYQDDMVGQRPPGAFYVLGVSQVLFGRSLVAARLTSVAFGLLLIVLTALLGRCLAGARGGLLAAAFLATQGSIIGYYATAHYHAMVAAILVGGLLVWLSADTPARNLAGTALLGTLFFFRTHMWPLLPVVLLLALRRARGAGERFLVAALVVVPPAAFFLWDRRHLKILSLVPVVGEFVRPLGYLPFTYLDQRPYQDLDYQLWMLVKHVRRYEFLALAAVAIIVLVAWRLRRGSPSGLFLGNARVNLVAGVFLYLMGCLFVVFRINLKWIGVYFVSLAPLLTLVLGHLGSALAADPGLGRRTRRALAAALAALLLLPIYFNRNPLLPIGTLRAADPFRAAHLAGEHLARVVPRGVRVFLFGQVDVFYLSGLPPTHLQQITNYDTLAVRDENNWATMRSGYYGMLQVEQWLGAEADYAVIWPEGLTVFAEGFHNHPDINGPKVARIRTLLRQHFEKIDTVSEFPYYSYEVYRRASRPAP